MNDPEKIGSTLHKLKTQGSLNDVYAMACGRFTPNQRQIVRDRCKISTTKYITLLNFLIGNHPSYSDVLPPSSSPEPTLIGMEQTSNNTDESNGENNEQETNIDTIRFSYAPSDEPTQDTGCFKNESDFITSEIKGRKPTLLFSKGNRIMDHLLKLEEVFATKFPFGRGGLDEKRDTKVSKESCLKHYSRIALPNFQTADFLLVVCSLYQRMLSFRNCIISCRSPLSSKNLGERLSVVTLDDVEKASKECLENKKSNNEVMSRLFSSISGHCKAIGQSNEAAKDARYSLFSLWHLFGCPAIFFTITPCDLCSFRVRLFATVSEHSLPTHEDMFDEEYCFLDLQLRKSLRHKNPGACALEYESIMQIVIEVLIGWNKEKGMGTNGIFGKVQAYGNACEEQSRYTIHSHICVWIENFNILRELLFHKDNDVREKARTELTRYFELVSQASLGDLIFTSSSVVTGTTQTTSPNNILSGVCKQNIRDMRHHIHSQKLGGKIAQSVTDSQVDKFTGNTKHSSTDLVQNNTCTLLPPSNSMDVTNRNQLDIFSYTYPYHAIDNRNMFPQDCSQGQSDLNITNILNTFKLRYPLLQLRFNVHDSEHRPSCFKKGCECRNNLPQYQQPLADIVFDEKNNNVVWHFVDGSTRKITPFKYMPKRGIADQFMNMNNDIVSTLFACNNNVTSGDKIRFYYITMYQSKNNQTEESASYYSVCSTLCRRLKYQMQVNESNHLAQTPTTVVDEPIVPDYCEGLKRTLSALYAHTSGNVLSATMSHLLLYQKQRFTFSHDFVDIPTKHILQWCDGDNDSLTFRLRKVKIGDNEYDLIGDYAINNIIYRPTELEDICIYEQLMLYELKKFNKKKEKRQNVMEMIL